MIEPVKRRQVLNSIQISKQNHSVVYNQTQKYLDLFFVSLSFYRNLHRYIQRTLIKIHSRAQKGPQNEENNQDSSNPRNPKRRTD